MASFTPYDAAKDTIARAEVLLDLATGLSRTEIRKIVGASAKYPVRTDLRRLAIVMAVAALDTYMHRLIVSRAYEHKTMPAKLAGLEIRFEDLIGQADAAVLARKEGRETRPRVPAKRILRERLGRETYQRYDRVSEALGMAGRSNSWELIAAAMPGAPSRNEVKLKLNGIVDRRNAIAHEGDYVRLDRPQTARRVELTSKEARQSVRFLSELIEAIHTVIS